MKRHILAIVAIIITALVIVAAIFHVKNARFALSSEYYGVSEIQAIDSTTLNQLISDHKSFGLFVSQPSCQASADLEKYLNDFINVHQMKFYEISFSALKDDNIIPDLRFYPSFVIFHDGKVVDFLEADSDEDAAAYTSVAGFEEWFSGYAQLAI